MEYKKICHITKKGENQMDNYKIVLESQLGPREGTLQLEDQNGILKGTIRLLGYQNPFSGEWTGDHSFRIFHHLRTHVSDLCCTSIFKMEKDKITGILQNDLNVMKWHGEKETEKKGGNAENGRE